MADALRSLRILVQSRHPPCRTSAGTRGGLRPYVDEMKAVVKKAIGRRSKSKTTPDTPAPQGAMADLMEKAHAHDVEHANDTAKVMA